MMHLSKAFALTALPVFVVASCGGDTTSGSRAGGGETDGSTEASVIRVDLAAVGGSATEGAVSLTLNEGSYSTVVSIDTHRGPGDYPVHIHTGSCAEGGSVVVPLTSVEGQEGGEGQSRTTFSASDLPAGGSYFVQLHDAQDQSAIGCADLPSL